MKQKILRSSIAEIKDFAAAAATHAVEMKAWRSHMKRVDEDRKKDVPFERRHVAYPKPRSHPIVESAVDENDEANFEIVDDGPSAAEKLAERKTNLIHQILLAEQSAKAALVPIGKLRLYNLRENDIVIADAERAAAAAGERTVIDKVLGRKDVKQTVEASRPPEDTAFLAEQKARRDRFADIERKAAQAMHDVEDLTAETVDSWKMPTF